VLASSTLTASGQLGIYSIVEKVIFEPNEQSPERIQIWGAFAHVDGDLATAIPQRPGTAGAIRRGYLYFRLPARNVEPTKKEWMDLKSVAGTGQVVGFGRWLYIGTFLTIDPDKPSRGNNYGPIYLPEGGADSGVDLRIRPESETPSAPAIYSTNVGLVKLASDGSRSELVKQLRDALKQ